MSEAHRAQHGPHTLAVASWIAASILLGTPACKRSSPHLAPGHCAWVFVRYEPSQWEAEWSQGEIGGERRDRECDVLASPVEVDRSVQLIRSTQDAMLRSKPIPPESIGLFSRMVYAQRCGPDARETGQQRVQLIEPLVGIVRDPLTICPRPKGVPYDVYESFGVGEGIYQSKRQFLIASAAPWSDSPDDPKSWRLGNFEPLALDGSARQHGRARQNILIDMGASTFSSWAGDTSSVGALWFVDRYKRHALTFDWVISYEIQKYDPNEIFGTVPADLLPHYVYYNQGVEKDPNGKWNPWRMLKEMGARPNDYIVIKLDIDAPDIENALVQQVMEDPGLISIIDEMFYEHHVNTKPMWPYWQTQGSRILLADTYRNFTFLRSKGVRMHSWP
jgi:hypothetical protein